MQKANKGIKQTVKTTRGAEEGEGKKRNRSHNPSSAPANRHTFDLRPNPPRARGWQPAVGAAPGGFQEPNGRRDLGVGMFASSRSFLCLIVVAVCPSRAHSPQDVIRLITPSQSAGHVHDFASNQAAAVAMETEVAECHAKRLCFARGKTAEGRAHKGTSAFWKMSRMWFFEGRF